MIFEVFASGGCRAYLLGCARTGAAVVIDPLLDQTDLYRVSAARLGLDLRHAIETHTHADHLSGARTLRARAGAAFTAHRNSPAPDIDLRLEDGETLRVGDLSLSVLHTPGHTADSMCLRVEDLVFTGDTLLVGGAGRTDLPSGDPEALHESLFGRLLRLPPETRVFPAHDYRDVGPSTIATELATNPRLQAPDRAAFVALMRGLELPPPRQMTAALRLNIGGGASLAQLLAEAGARTPVLTAADLADQRARDADEVVVLDLRPGDAFRSGRIPGAVHLPRGELELLIDKVLPDPRARLVCCCEDGRLALLGASTLRAFGYARTSVLEGGLRAWRAAGGPWDDESPPSEADWRDDP